MINLTKQTFQAVEFVPVILTAAATNSATNSIPPATRVVKVTGVTNDANDWITLPALADCLDGHTIDIYCLASSNFELRTPAASNEEINSEDCDGTKEALMTDTNIMTVKKINNTIGWMLEGRTAIGAYVTAVVPD